MYRIKLENKYILNSLIIMTPNELLYENVSLKEIINRPYSKFERYQNDSSCTT